MDLKGKYGLIIPAKEREAKAAEVRNAPRKPNVFANDDSSDSEPDEDTDWVKKTMKKQSHGSVQQKQSVQAIRKALSDDPTVYQYDELYDEMEKKREDSKEVKKQDRKAKYIEQLLKTAEKRKQEDEARNERLVQKEREKEGDMFQDKEAFVTGAYRKKMEELERIKEEERLRDQLDALVDVTKQKDLSGFYRHLYRQQVDEPEAKARIAEESRQTEKEKNDKNEVVDEVEIKAEHPSPNHGDISHEHQHLSPKVETNEETRELSNRSPKRERGSDRDYSSRRDSRERDSDRQRRDERHRDGSRSHRDYDRRQRDRSRDRNRDRSSDRKWDRRSDRRSDRSRERKRDRSRSRDRKRDRSRDKKRDRSSDKRRARDDSDRDRGERRKHEPKSEIPDVVDKKVKFTEEVKEVKGELKEEDESTEEPKVSIWAKRTVGAIFDEALVRYFARKQANTLQASIIHND